MHKRIIASLLAACLLGGTAVSLGGCGEETKTGSQGASATESTTAASNGKTDSAGADDIANGAILQAFSWDFNTIRESMPDIAAAGFSAVQTSPVNACLEGEGGGMEL